MTDSYPPPFRFPEPEPAAPKRPLFGKVFAWVAIVFGAFFLLGSLLDFQIGAVLVGLCLLAAGVVYLKANPAAGRKPWAIPALAVLPALILMGLTSPSRPTESVTDVPAVAALPSVDATSSRPTTPPKTTSPTTAPSTTSAAPTTTTAPPTTVPPETVTVYAAAPTTAIPYVPAPAPVYVEEPVYTQPAPLSAVVPDAPASAYYRNCTAAKAAGVAPIYAGSPGYRSELDRNNDGVACE